jgi:bacterial/archaeal transporter family-2 protein
MHCHMGATEDAGPRRPARPGGTRLIVLEPLSLLEGRAGKPPFSLEIWAVAIWSYLVFALLAGAMLPIQFGINAQLAEWLGGSVRAAFISFVVGAMALLVAVLVAARGWPDRAGDAPWWVWTGGLLGAFYVLGSIVTAPKLGAATLVALILAGQALASLAVDHFGWVGFDEQPVTLLRVLGMLLLAGGVALVRLS